MPSDQGYERKPSVCRLHPGQAAIESELLNAGNGARGIVYGARSDGTAHVWNAIVQDGRVNFVDFQAGGSASFSGFVATDFYFVRTG